jgi:sec-independent protein translocase protein TatA
MFRNLFEHPAFLLILVGLVAVLFGGKRLPDAARGLGRSMRIFKSEVKQMQDDDKKPKPASSPVEGRLIDPPGPVPGASADQPTGEQLRGA